MPKLSFDIPSTDVLAQEEINLGTTRPSLLLLVTPCFDALLNTSILVIFNQWFPEWHFWVYGVLPGFLRDVFVSPDITQAVIVSVLMLILYVPIILRGCRLWRTRYEVTSRRILSRSGIFNSFYEQVEMEDIRDIAVTKPFYLRLFKHGHLVVYTTDRTNTLVRMEGIRHPLALRAQLRELSQMERQRLACAPPLNE